MAENERISAIIDGILLPDRKFDTVRAVPRRAPCVTILIHGVNDVGEAFERQEAGLCQGLNQRLDREDLKPSIYKVPAEDRGADPLLEDPDSVYYRRIQGSESETIVIPFYWGYREMNGRDAEGTKYISTNENTHGQWTDRYGNRLDRNGAKNGGTFDNATSSLPAMWGRGHSGTILKLDANKLNNKATHPVLPSPPRSYMLLAAKRLAMLLKNLRAHPALNGNGKPAGKPNDTINLIAHSQGCLVSLLAHAFLEQDGVERGADVLIMNHPCYSLVETFAANVQEDVGHNTERSRIETLTNIVGWMSKSPNAVPEFTALADSSNNDGRAGMRFTIEAPERDNRGSVYLYFCPKDMTVSLANIQGIGWQGVPDEMSIYDKNDNPSRVTPVLSRLGPRFYQRVFTDLIRDGQPELVGTAPHDYQLREGKEESGDWPTNAGLPRQPRRINAPALPQPVAPRLLDSKTGDQNLIGPIDAAIAITNNTIKNAGIRTVEETIDKPDCLMNNRPGWLDENERQQVEDWYNRVKLQATSPQQEIRIIKAMLISDRELHLIRKESPDEARRRWQTKESMQDSCHSSIVANSDFSRDVTAWDIAVGKGESIDDETFYTYLCLLADWRVQKGDPNYKKLSLSHFYANTIDKHILDANIKYYSTGKLPPEYVYNDDIKPDAKTGVKRVSLPIPRLIDCDTVTMRTRRLERWNKRVSN